MVRPVPNLKRRRLGFSRSICSLACMPTRQGWSSSRMAGISMRFLRPRISTPLLIVRSIFRRVLCFNLRLLPSCSGGSTRVVAGH